MITRERLMELLEYDPVTGVFTWKVSRSGTVKAGSVAGYARRDGYRLAAKQIHHPLPTQQKETK